MLLGSVLLAAGVVTAEGLTLDRSGGTAPPSGGGPTWVQRFPIAVALGSVGADGTFPGYGYGDLHAYPDGVGSTHGGQYRPSTINSIEDHVLTWHVHGSGLGSSVTIGPSAVGGEWSVRMRTDVIAGMHIADMRWPDDNVWPGTDGSGGEVDFPEEDTTGALPYVAVVANAGRMKNGAQAFNPRTTTRVPEPWTEWHVYTTQIVPGESITVLQDGIRIARVTENVPRTAVHEQFQVEPRSAAGAGNVSGIVQVSGVAYSPVLNRSTITQVAADGERG